MDPDDPVLAELKSYSDFPKNQEWIDNTLRRVLQARASGESPALPVR
jgi:hypothetical protein